MIFRPRNLLSFIEMHGFSNDWSDLDLTDDDLHTLQMTIMRQPKGAPVIPGIAGLRKLRFAPAKWKTGKSGGIRVCYVYFEEYAIILLVVAYSKNEFDDLSAVEKKSIRKLIEEQAEEFAKGPFR